ncbi:EpsG family protein [Leptospira sp. 96542]|nr:EpsG family protein [Leptospira sp. 96542]
MNQIKSIADNLSGIIFHAEDKVSIFFHEFGLDKRVTFSYFCFISILLLTLPFSPILVVFFSFFILVLFSERINTSHRRILGMLLLVAYSIIISSRQRFISQSDDMNYYYWFYTNISANIYNWDGMVYSDFLFYFFIKSLKILFPVTFSPDFFLFLFSFLSSFIFFIWLEFFALVSFEHKYHSMILAISLFYFSYFMSTQAVRQMIAIPLVLIAFSSSNRLNVIFILIISTFIHSSSLVMYLLFYLSRFNIQRVFVLILVAFGVFKLLQPVLIGAIGSGTIPNESLFKMIYSYLTWELGEDHRSFFFSMLRLPVFSLICFLVFWRSSFSIYRNMFFIFLLAYLITYEFPFVPLRMAMPTFFVLIGFMKIVSVYPIKNLYRILIIVVSLNFLRIQLSGVVGDSSGFNLYHSFSVYSFKPFYYLNSILDFLINE